MQHSINQKEGIKKEKKWGGEGGAGGDLQSDLGDCGKNKSWLQI